MGLCPFKFGPLKLSLMIEANFFYHLEDIGARRRCGGFGGGKRPSRRACSITASTFTCIPEEVVLSGVVTSS